MNILYIGNFEPRHSTENHIASTLEDMGHRVTRIQEVGSNAVPAEHVSLILYQHDLLLWTRTPPGLKGEAQMMLKTAEHLGIATVAYHLDLYAGLQRWVDVQNEPWWNCQYVFTADGGSDDFWKENGINHFWMPPGVWKEECYLADPGQQRYDVIFTGQRNYHKEWSYRAELIDFLESEYGNRFRRFPMPGEAAVRNHDLNVLYASARVVVGDSLCLGFDHPNYWSDRVPETIGRGGFLIMPEIEGLSDHYVTDNYGKMELMTYTFGDFHELKITIDYYLDFDDEREAVRKAGFERTLADHTYHNRMEAMLQIVKP